MDNSDGRQKGPQQHAEGQHGRKTHSKFIEDLHGKHGGSPESEGSPQSEPGTGDSKKGGSHLFEDRQQHDEAEKNSEHSELARQLGRAGERPGSAPSTKGRPHS